MGSRRAPTRPGNREALSRFLLPLAIAEFGQDAAAAYGRVRAALESGGTPIGPLDTLIAGHAVSLGVMLVTNNVREFGRVPGLAVEDWVSETGPPGGP
jgi:tRNA(fMet)-specific endonuclease VapC